MATISNGESGSSVRTKLNEIINKVEGVTSINNNIDVTGTITSDGLTVDGVGEVIRLSGSSTNAYIRSTDGITNQWYIGSGGNAGLQHYVYQAQPITFHTSASEAMRITADGDLLVGLSSSSTAGTHKVIIKSASTVGTVSSHLALVGDSAINGQGPQILFSESGDGTSWAGGTIGFVRTGGNGIGDLVFGTRGTTGDINTTTTEAMRIDSSGNLLVGKSEATISTDGAELRPTGEIVATTNGLNVAYFNRRSSDGSIAEFRKDGTTVGIIGVASGNLTISSSGSNPVRLQYNGNSVAKVESGSLDPANDDTQDLGQLGVRWDDVYATNGTIQTSDANEKQDIEELTEAERRVAVAAKGLLRKFRWKDAVAEKGDDARIHFGIIAQDLQAAFEAEGLDAGRYAMFIHSTWTDEETGEEKSRMGVRYSELLAFIIAAI